MIEYREIPETAVVEMRVDGRVTRDAFEQISTQLEAFIIRHGQVRILEVIDHFGGIDASVLWDDIKFSLRHLNDFSRVAIVTDKRWIELWTKATRRFVKCEVALFHQDQIDAARAWLNEPEAKKGAAK